MEAVLPIEVEIPSLRVLKEVELEEAEWIQVRYEQLNLVEEKRMMAICHGQLYQRIFQVFIVRLPSLYTYLTLNQQIKRTLFCSQ